MAGSDAIYGRNWGCAYGLDVKHLHFELCYYQAIEAAIERGLPRVEAGAQGEVCPYPRPPPPHTHAIPHQIPPPPTPIPPTLHSTLPLHSTPTPRPHTLPPHPPRPLPKTIHQCPHPHLLDSVLYPHNTRIRHGQGRRQDSTSACKRRCYHRLPCRPGQFAHNAMLITSALTPGVKNVRSESLSSRHHDRRRARGTDDLPLGDHLNHLDFQCPVLPSDAWVALHLHSLLETFQELIDRDFAEICLQILATVLLVSVAGQRFASNAFEQRLPHRWFGDSLRSRFKFHVWLYRCAAQDPAGLPANADALGTLHQRRGLQVRSLAASA